MDNQFLEFWGNFLIQTARGQRQLDDMIKWMGQGLKGVEDLSEMFRKVYGLDGTKKDTPEYLQTWEKASREFMKSFENWSESMGMIPPGIHQELVKKYEVLKKKAASQEETIRRLKMLLAEKGSSPIDEVKNFQDLMQKQADQFQQLMDGLGKAFNKDSTHT
jgi:hypothetical protein